MAYASGELYWPYIDIKRLLCPSGGFWSLAYMLQETYIGLRCPIVTSAGDWHMVYKTSMGIFLNVRFQCHDWFGDCNSFCIGFKRLASASGFWYWFHETCILPWHLLLDLKTVIDSMKLSSALGVWYSTARRLALTDQKACRECISYILSTIYD